MKFEIIEVKTKEQLDYLDSCSAMTWEGLIEEDFEVALESVGTEGAKGYVIKGEVMNKLCKLTGSNAYPKDLNIFAVDKFHGLALQWGARWIGDILCNNADRQRQLDKRRN